MSGPGGGRVRGGECECCFLLWYARDGTALLHAFTCAKRSLSPSMRLVCRDLTSTGAVCDDRSTVASMASLQSKPTSTD